MKYIVKDIEGKDYLVNEEGNAVESINVHRISLYQTECFDYPFHAKDSITSTIIVHVDEVICFLCGKTNLMFHNEPSATYIEPQTSGFYREWYYKGDLIFGEQVKEDL